MRLPDCRAVKGLPGPEDFDLDLFDPAHPRLIVSVQERRAKDETGHFKHPGKFVSIPLLAEGPGPFREVKIEGRDGMRLHLHGISLVRTKEKSLLYAINHVSESKHVIEIFELKADRLVFQKRLEDPLIFSPNDLIALPDGQIYVTNDHIRRGCLGLLGDLFSASWSNVVHYKDGRWTVAAEGLAYANGIAVNKTGDRLFVTATRDSSIQVFRRDVRTGKIGERVKRIEIGTGGDNLLWENDFVLNTTLHPSLFAFLRHYGDAENHSPSVILRVNVKTGKATRILADEGGLIDAASTALIFRGRLYLGQVFDPEVVHCKARP